MQVNKHSFRSLGLVLLVGFLAVGCPGQKVRPDTGRLETDMKSVAVEATQLASEFSALEAKISGWKAEADKANGEYATQSTNEDRSVRIFTARRARQMTEEALGPDLQRRVDDLKVKVEKAKKSVEGSESATATAEASRAKSAYDNALASLERVKKLKADIKLVDDGLQQNVTSAVSQANVKGPVVSFNKSREHVKNTIAERESAEKKKAHIEEAKQTAIKKEKELARIKVLLTSATTPEAISSAGTQLKTALAGDLSAIAIIDGVLKPKDLSSLQLALRHFADSEVNESDRNLKEKQSKNEELKKVVADAQKFLENAQAREQTAKNTHNKATDAVNKLLKKSDAFKDECCAVTKIGVIMLSLKTYKINLTRALQEGLLGSLDHFKTFLMPEKKNEATAKFNKLVAAVNDLVSKTERLEVINAQASVEKELEALNKFVESEFTEIKDAESTNIKEATDAQANLTKQQKDQENLAKTIVTLEASHSSLVNTLREPLQKIANATDVGKLTKPSNALKTIFPKRADFIVALIDKADKNAFLLIEESASKTVKAQILSEGDALVAAEARVKAISEKLKSEEKELEKVSVKASQAIEPVGELALVGSLKALDGIAKWDEKIPDVKIAVNHFVEMSKNGLFTHAFDITKSDPVPKNLHLVATKVKGMTRNDIDRKGNLDYSVSIVALINGIVRVAAVNPTDTLRSDIERLRDELLADAKVKTAYDRYNK